MWQGKTRHSSPPLQRHTHFVSALDGLQGYNHVYRQWEGGEVKGRSHAAPPTDSGVNIQHVYMLLQNGHEATES